MNTEDRYLQETLGAKVPPTSDGIEHPTAEYLIEAKAVKNQFFYENSKTDPDTGDSLAEMDFDHEGFAIWLKKRDEERDADNSSAGLWWSENELYLFDLCVGSIDYEDLGEFGAWVAYDHADNVIGRFDDDNTDVPESSARTSVVDSFNNWKAKYGIALRKEATNA